MGKSPKAVRFLVHPDLAGLPEFVALREQGHTVHSWDDVYDNPGTYDAIIGPTSWRMTQAHIKYLPLTIAEARRLRYSPKEKP